MAEHPPLHDYSRSRAVIMGAWDFRYLPRVEPARNSFERMVSLLTGKLCDWPEDRLLTLENEARPGDIPDRLIRAFDDVTDVALFYYVGHGQVDSRNQLCLALTESVQDWRRRASTSLPFSAVSAALDCDATTKIVILDCCYAAIVNRPGTGTQAPPADVIDKTIETGAYTMAATSANDTAWYEDDPSLPFPQTFFTKYFVDLIERGIENQPAVLKLDPIFHRLRTDLAKARRPVPEARNVDSARDFVFARNAAPKSRQRDPEALIENYKEQLDDVKAQLAAANEQIGALTAARAEALSDLERFQVQLARENRQELTERQQILQDQLESAERGLQDADTDGPTTGITVIVPVEPERAEPADEPTDEPVEEPTDELVEEPAAEPADELVDEPAAEPANWPADEVIEEPAAERLARAESPAAPDVAPPIGLVAEETVIAPAVAVATDVALDAEATPLPVRPADTTKRPARREGLWARRRVILLVIGACVVFGLAAVLLRLLLPQASHQPRATATSYSFTARQYSDGLVVMRHWTLSGPNGSELTERLSVSNVSGAALHVQFKEPVPAAVFANLATVQYSGETPTTTDSGHVFVWDISLAVAGHEVITYRAKVAPGGIASSRLQLIARRFDVAAANLPQATPQVQLSSLKIAAKTIRVAAGKSVRITLTGTMSNGMKASAAVLAMVRWAVGNPAIAKVSASGRLTGLAQGRTQVTARLNGASASAIVIVKPGASTNPTQIPGGGAGQGTQPTPNSGGTSSTTHHTTPPPSGTPTITPSQTL